VQAALTSTDPLEIELQEVGTDFAFFMVSVYVRKTEQEEEN
jgi:hypothetical protein